LVFFVTILLEEARFVLFLGILHYIYTLQVR